MFFFHKALSALTTLPVTYTRLASFDFETTGTNLHHESRPFMLSITYDDGEQELWEADINPLTRIPSWSADDKEEIASRFQHEDWLYIGSNVKFDVRCLTLICEVDPVELLCRCHDTIMEHHAVNNAEPHGLKDAAVKYAGVSDSDEKDLKVAVREARTIAKKLGWAVASKATCPQQRRAPPSKAGGWAVMDLWLPRAVAKHNWETSVAGQTYKRRTSTTFLERMSGLSSMQGWEWHPPSVFGANSHPWYSLCATYCSRDTLRSLVLHKAFTAALLKDNLYDNYLENRTSLPISYLTEERGITINIETAKSLISRFTTDRRNAEFAIKGCLNIAGFNCSSPKQVAKILYGYFQVPVTRYTAKSIANNKRDPSKPLNPTTDADFIGEVIKLVQADLLADGDSYEDYAPPLWQEGVEPYRDFQRRITTWYKSLVEKEKPSSRQLFSFASALLMFKRANTGISFLEGYLHACLPIFLSSASRETWSHPKLPEPTFAILHPSLNPVGTKTTRYSSSNPNGQNISKGGKGKKGLEWLFKTNHSLRSVFGPAPDREWWSFDYHQIQLVIFAILCGDEKMIAAAHEGKDFHIFMAQQIFGSSFVAEEESTEHKYQRDIAKTVNFAFIFGAQEDKLNRTAGMPGLYNILCNVFPDAIDFLQRTEWDVRQDGYVVTSGGYRLYVPEGQEHAGVNYKVQGSEGEIVKRAQYGIQAWLDRSSEARGADIYSCLYVHDELIFDCKKNQGYQFAGGILSIMNDAASSFGIPCKAEVKLITENWSRSKKLEQRTKA